MKSNRARKRMHAALRCTMQGDDVHGAGNPGGLPSRGSEAQGIWCPGVESLRGWQKRGLRNGISCWAVFEIELAVPVTVYSADSRPVHDPVTIQPVS